MQKNQLYKGSLSTIVLKLLNDKGKMYGYQITREVEKITSGELVISVEIQKVNNRPRKYYFLTENGKKESVNLLNEMKAFIENMDVLLNPKLA